MRDVLSTTVIGARLTLWSWIARRRRFFCFVAVGGTVGLIYFIAALFLTDVLHIDVFWASLLAYSCMIPISFWGHKIVTYKSRARALTEFPRFCFTAGLGLFLSMITVKLLSGTLHLPSYVSVGTVLVVVPLLSYLLMTVWVFGVNYLDTGDQDSS
jgi:putative flippase GtrA